MAMLIIVTVLFSCMWSGVAQALHWAGSLQIVTMAFLGAVSGLIVWIGATILFGRAYCSSVCPLGTLQDCFARLNRLTPRRRARRPYRYVNAANRFRYTWLTLIAGCCIAGVPAIIVWTDPYTIFSRMATPLLHPAAEWISGMPVIITSWLATGIAVVLLAVTGLISGRHGRIICNTVCPVGSSLSLLSYAPLFHFDIDTDRCTNCRACEHVCKAQCINLTDHVVDSSRCVVCFNCVDMCDDDAIRYTWRHKKLSIPLMQPVKPLPSATLSCKTLQNPICNNISTFCSTSSPKECRKPTAPEPEPEACSATRCDSTSPTDSPCSQQKSSISNR